METERVALQVPAQAPQVAARWWRECLAGATAAARTFHRRVIDV